MLSFVTHSTNGAFYGVRIKPTVPKRFGRTLGKKIMLTHTDVKLKNVEYCGNVQYVAI